jgi:hypothetical protein
MPDEKKFKKKFNEGTQEESIPSEKITDKAIKTFKKVIDPIAEANESLITMNPAPFDGTLELMNEDELPQNDIGHNQQEISALLKKINVLEKKFSTMEAQSSDFTNKFENLENVVERFEELEIDPVVEYENEKFKKLNLFGNSEITLMDKPIPNNTEDIIVQAEGSLILNKEKKKSSLVENSKNNTQRNFKNGILLFFTITIVILYLFDKFGIFELNEIIKQIISLFKF